MAKITLPDGTVFEGDNPKDAADTAYEFLKRKGEASPPPTNRPFIPPRNRVLPRPVPESQKSNGYDTAGVALELLEAIKAAGHRGVPGSKVMQIVRSDHLKGIGGRMVRINRFLKTTGFENTKDLFDNPRDEDSTSRVWKPKKNIDAAIEAVRKVAQG